MFVDTVDTGVCGSYITPYTEYYEVWKLCIRWPLTPAKREGYCVSLPSWGFSCSPVWGGSFVNFLDLTTTRVIAGKMHSQSPILKSKGALSNLVILTYLWDQSCILHTLTNCLPVLNFDLKSVFSAWRLWACIISLELAGSVLCTVRSHEQVD